MTKNSRQNNQTYSCDRALEDSSQDAFNFQGRIVDRIFSFILNNNIMPITIAITGEWGSGKSTAINFLKRQLAKDKKNIIIYFEPLLDGKVEIVDIIEQFYLQLHSKCKDKKLREYIKKSISSLALLSRLKVTGKVSIPNIGEVGLEKEIIDDVKKAIDLWRENQPELLHVQAKNINSLLKEKKRKLYVVIDELDRLTSEKIVNFLLFTRVLELFDNLVCVVGIDYIQTLNKLVNESYLGLGNYDSARSYLDKLFQCKYHVYTSIDEKIKYAVEGIKLIDSNNYLTEILATEDYNECKEFSDIIEFLSTPRQIKKWLLNIRANYPLLKVANKKMCMLKFLAATIVHPVIFENLAKHSMKMLNSNYLQSLLKEDYGIDIPYNNEEEKIILQASLGVSSPEIENCEQAQKVQDALNIKFNDCVAEKMTRHFFKNMEKYLINLLVEGYFDENTVTAFYEFFSGDINKTLEKLSEKNSFANIIASDLVNSLDKYSLGTFPITFKSDNKCNINISLLNELWRKKGEVTLGNPYPPIIWYSLAKCGDLNKIINDADISLSEDIIISILNKFGIKNENGQYNLRCFNNKPKVEDIYTRLLPEKNIESLKQILKTWLERVEMIFDENNSIWEKERDIVSVFYRYIQFSEACNMDNTNKLSSFLIKFLKNKKQSISVKTKIIEFITEECRKHTDPFFGNNSTISPIERLFATNKQLVKLISDFSQRHNIKNINYFDKVLEHT